MTEPYAKSKKLLTIGIPTYNRSETLKKTLDKLSKENNEDFHIIVSDNNSSDNTPALIKEYQKIMPNLAYNRNEMNVGFSRNILKIYELTETRYLWFLSDDETILPGSIDKILQALIKYKPVVALFNHLTIDPYGRKIVDGVGKDILYKDINQLTDYSKLLRVCFISVLVLEKRLSLDVLERACDQKNVYFQMTLVLLLLSNKFRFCEIAYPVVFRNTGFKSGEFFKFMMTDYLRAIFMIKHRFDNKKFVDWSKKQIFNNLQLFLSQKLGLYKYNGRISRQTIARVFQYYGFTSILILFFPILYYLIPSILLKFIYRVRLWGIHGRKDGDKIYKKNINRALRFKRGLTY